MSTKSELKVLHDQLLEQMPDGAKHDEGTCPLCAMADIGNHDSTSGGLMPETYTQEDVDAAVAAATADLSKRLEELGAHVHETEVSKAVASAVAEKETTISELQTQLDAAEASRTAAETALAETIQFWTDAIESAQQQAAFAARRDERVAKAKEANVLTEEYLLANADRYAAMSDEEFADRLSEWRLIASKTPATPTPGQIPAKTALVASQAEPTQSRNTNLGLIAELRAARVDPRTLGGS